MRKSNTFYTSNPCFLQSHNLPLPCTPRCGKPKRKKKKIEVIPILTRHTPTPQPHRLPRAKRRPAGHLRRPRGRRRQDAVPHGDLVHGGQARQRQVHPDRHHRGRHHQHHQEALGGVRARRPRQVPHGDADGHVPRRRHVRRRLVHAGVDHVRGAVNFREGREGDLGSPLVMRRSFLMRGVKRRDDLDVRLGGGGFTTTIQPRMHQHTQSIITT